MISLKSSWLEGTKFFQEFTEIFHKRLVSSAKTATSQKETGRARQLRWSPPPLRRPAYQPRSRWRGEGELREVRGVTGWGQGDHGREWGM